MKSYVEAKMYVRPDEFLEVSTDVGPGVDVYVKYRTIGRESIGFIAWQDAADLICNGWLA